MGLSSTGPTYYAIGNQNESFFIKTKFGVVMQKLITLPVSVGSPTSSDVVVRPCMHSCTTFSPYTVTVLFPRFVPSKGNTGNETSEDLALHWSFPHKTSCSKQLVYFPVALLFPQLAHPSATCNDNNKSVLYKCAQIHQVTSNSKGCTRTKGKYFGQNPLFLPSPSPYFFPVF